MTNLAYENYLDDWPRIQKTVQEARRVRRLIDRGQGHTLDWRYLAMMRFNWSNMARVDYVMEDPLTPDVPDCIRWCVDVFYFRNRPWSEDEFARWEMIKVIYHKHLDRYPDQEGCDYWMHEGTPLANLEDAIVSAAGIEDETAVVTDLTLHYSDGDKLTLPLEDALPLLQ